MSAVTFDTLKYVRQLEAAGIASQQAEAFVTAQRDILSEALDTQLATKADIAGLRVATSADIAGLRAATSADIAGLRAATKADIAGLRAGTSADNADLKIDINALRADMEKLELRMTIKLGSMILVAMGGVAAIVKLL